MDKEKRMRVSQATQQKARRLIKDGKVTITRNDMDVIAGTVQGDTGIWVPRIDPEGPHCTCPAGENHVTCSHVLALVGLRAELEAPFDQTASGRYDVA